MTNQATIERPQIRVARPKQEDKKKGALLPWWTTGAKGSASGAAGALGGLGGKLLLTALIAAIGAGAHLAGVADRPAPGLVSRAKARKLFETRDAKPTYDVDPNTLPGKATGSADSIAMLWGTASKAEPEKQPEKQSVSSTASSISKNAAGDAAKTEAPAPDAAALLGAAAEKTAGANEANGKDSKASRFQSKIGALSSSFGGSSALSGGAGLAAGSNGAFSSLKAPSFGGRTSAFSNETAKLARESSRRTRSTGRGAFGQLVNAARLSQAGAKASGEAASTAAGAAFDGGAAGGSAITGAGAGTGGAGTAAGQGGAAPSAGSDGGPISSSPGSGAEAPTAPKTSDCDVMSKDTGTDLVANATGGCVPDPAAKDHTPWSDDSQRAQYALMVAAIALALAQLLNTWAKNNSTWGKFCKIAVRLLAVVALGAAVTAFVEGAIIMGKGGQIEGVMDMLGGLISGVMAVKLLKDSAGSDKDVKTQLNENQQSAQDMANDKLKNGPQHWDSDGTDKGWTHVPELEDAPQTAAMEDKPFISNSLPSDVRAGDFDANGNATYVNSDAGGGGTYTYGGQNTDGKPVFTYEPPEGVSGDAKWVAGSNGEHGFWIDPHTGEEWTPDDDGAWSRAQRD